MNARALTALRGIAAWWVVAFHFREAVPVDPHGPVMHVLARGYLAVDLFFVLSGYVIGLNYASWFSGGAGLYGRFLALRLSRIYPLHAVMLLMFLIKPAAIMLSGGALEDARWGYYGLSFLLVQDWGITQGLAWNVPAWSISAEWLAYLLFPLLAIGAGYAARGALRALALALALLLTLGVVSAAFSPSGLSWSAQWFSLVRCLSEFSAGMCLYHLEAGRLRQRWEAGAGLAVAAACACGFILLPMPDYALMPLCFTALIFALADERGWLARLLRWAPLQWLGLVSYSTYMVHYLLKDWVKFVLVRPGVPPGAAFVCYVVVVCAASGVLYEIIERPGQAVLRRALNRKAELAK